MRLFLAVELAAFVALLGIAAVLDLRDRRIPNTVTVPGLLAGLVLAAIAEGGWPWAAAGGAALAFLATFPLFAFGVLGAGDAKLFTATGAFLGPAGLVPAAVYAGVAGGLLAVVSVIRRGVLLPTLLATRSLLFYVVTLGQHGERPPASLTKSGGIPYGVAIAMGALMAWFYPYLPGGAP